ncbi:MAG: DUF1828 domain-containing protein [Chlorobium sp.]
MTDLTHCDSLKSGIGELFTCTKHGDFQRIQTPFLYPDGDNIDLFCKTDGDTVTITDLAETVRWLHAQSASSSKRSTKQRQLIEDTCLTHGVELYRGMILGRCRPGDSFAMVVTRVAQAAVRVSDLWFTFKTRTVESITDEVADCLADKKLPFTRFEKLAGRSGRAWAIDFHVRSAFRSSLVSVLKTSNRSSARPIVEHTVAAWYDLNHLAAGPEGLNFISLFDDTSDVWSDEDFKLVEPLSTISRWSRPDEFVNILSEVAS